MIKSKSTYVWDNVDNIIQIIESQIDFIYHTTDLYDPQFCSREEIDCSLQSSKCIRELMHTKKLLGVEDGFK